MRVLSLYIHVPFCTRRCSYCSFYHVPSRSDAEADYVDALEDEIAWTLARLDAPRLRSVFVGGGTPSVLEPDFLDRVFAAFEPWLDPAVTEEVTVELNPEDVSADLVAFLRGRGVTRVSLGVQSMDPAAQRVLKRCTPAQNLRAIETVMRAFDNVSFDVLIGVPGSDVPSFRNTLDTLIAFRPAHFSVYCLEPGGDMSHEVAGFFAGVDADRSGDEYMMACDLLAGTGYRHYEISNFAQPGRESVHNAVYWSGDEYLGVGPGAHSYMEKRRFHNAPSLAEYLSHSGGERIARRRHDTGAVNSGLERLMLGLRTSNGVPREWCGCGADVLRDLAADGLVEHDERRVRLTDRGFLMLDDLVFRLGGAGPLASGTDVSC